MAERNAGGSAALVADLELMQDAAIKAGDIAMGYFSGENRVWQKSGNSPVSEADLAVDNFLRDTLIGARPAYGWLSEETEDNAARLDSEMIFVVDPIDGTRGFVAGASEWCISVGLVQAGRPVAGVLVCPALESTYSALAGGGSHQNGRLLAPSADTSIRTVTASRKLNSLLEARYPDAINVRPFVPSLAYRIALVATGEIDAAFARPGANDWDLAAAEIILTEAGGLLTDLSGKPRLYNQKKTGSPSLIASGPGKHANLIRLAEDGGFLA